MFAFSRIKLWIFVGILCIVITTIHIAPVMADNNGMQPKKSSDSNITTNKTLSNSDNSDATCVSCPDTQPTCPMCPQGVKCVLSIRTCRTCPQASCENSSLVSEGDSSNNNSTSTRSVLPGVIGGVLGAIVLIIAGLGYFVFRQKSRRDRGTKLEETTSISSINSANVIPIAYIPSTTLTTPENTYQGPNGSLFNAGSADTLIDLTEDDASCEVGTILQATKASPVAAASNTATLVTATRVKPALVRINTIKSTNNSVNPTRSGAQNTDRSLLNTPSTTSLQNNPTTTNVIVGDNNTVNGVPRIDIERPSGELSRPSNQATSSSRQNLNSPLSDPIEGRQSFGLFGSDEVYSTDPVTPQQRESTVSSTSTNGRSTMFSDEGDGEIMIFWGGNDAPFMPAPGTPGVIDTTGTSNKADDKEINSKIENPNKNTTKTKEEDI